MSNKKNVLFLGNSGFPYGLAEVQKILLISKCLVSTGNNVTVVCNTGVHKKKDHPEMTETGEFQGIHYIYTSGTPFYHEHLISRNLLKIKGAVKEIQLIIRRARDKKLDYAILSTHQFFSVFIYFILSRLFGFKVILNYVEYSSGIKKEWYRFRTILNDKLFDKYAPLLADGILPISEFLINHLKKIAPKKSYFKIPGLTDYDRYNDIETLEQDKYFLFCGAANYKETVFFIIDSFAALNSCGKDLSLFLVINGNPNDVKDIKDYINSNVKKDSIKFFTKLSDKQLTTYYKNALALLIPLRPTFQDIARFPHKIGEYLGSGNPVISTNIGEVKYYFKDMGEMLIADEYNIDKFAAKMQSVIDDPEAAKKIGEQGKKLGLSIFHYQTKAPEINNFLDKFNHKQ
ncbi:MAG: glycosyltransferase [Ferruginibacter sp.]